MKKNHAVFTLIMIFILLICSFFLYNHFQQKRVYFENKQLHINTVTIDFSHWLYLIKTHGDYLLVRDPERSKTQIYSISRGEKLMEVNQYIEDYDGTNIINVYNGYHIGFNGKKLGYYCLDSYVVNNSSILCVTQLIKSENSSYKLKDSIIPDRLISINPQTNTSTIIYTPKNNNVISTVSFIHNYYYIGEYNYFIRKSFITVNQVTKEINHIPNFFYAIGNNVYVATIGNFNSIQPAYFEVNAVDNSITVIQKDDKKVILK